MFYNPIAEELCRRHKHEEPQQRFSIMNALFCLWQNVRLRINNIETYTYAEQKQKHSTVHQRQYIKKYRKLSIIYVKIS